MTKKVDWESTFKNPIQRNLSGNANVEPKYSSGKDRLQKAFELEKEQEAAREMLNKAMPAMSALLKCRLQSKTPLVVQRPLVYQSSELRTYTNGAKFEDVQKSVYPGTQLILKSLDPNMQEFIFEDQEGNEVVLPYTSQIQLMTQTNIYEDVKKFIEENSHE